MDAHQSKILPKRSSAKEIVPPTELEMTVAKAIYDIQTTNSELAGDLALLQIRGAREVELEGGRKSIVILVPVPQLKGWRRIQTRVLRELEKKLSAGGERSVLIIAFRRILPKPSRTSMTIRPRSRTLTAVHDAWLEDMVYPTEVIGRRTRVKTDGTRLMKVFLDNKDQTTMESRTEVMANVYRKMTGKNITFEFAAPIVQEDEGARRKKKN